MTSRGMKYIQGETKRVFDISAASLLLPSSGIIAGLAAGALALELQTTKVLFKQERNTEGGGDTPLAVYKLRTLSLEPQIGSSTGPKQDAELITHGTFDPRARKIGLFVRRSGIDETPQLLNILEGTMTMVGNRPMVDKDYERFEAAEPALFRDWHQHVSVIRPGLIGKSQILRHNYIGEDDELLIQSMKLDMKYFENASLRGDIAQLAVTPYALLKANLNTVTITS